MQEKLFLLAPFKKSFYNFMEQKAISFPLQKLKAAQLNEPVL